MEFPNFFQHEIRKFETCQKHHSYSSKNKHTHNASSHQ
jgi:hypothetical protein